MKLGRILRGLSASSLLALASVPFAPAVASAAPAAPAAYAVVARAYPLYWAGSSGLPVAGLRVPYVAGETNNLPISEAKAVLTQPDLAVTTMSGESIAGLSCAGIDERKCADPFLPQVVASHNVVDAGRAEQAASFTGKDGKYPGRIRALAECGGDCGRQLVRTVAEAAGPPGGLAGYISIGGSSASYDMAIDDRGRLIGTARSELRDVVIGPKAEVRIGSLTTMAEATGAGSANSKDGKADLRITDFVILDNPVELTRSGLKLAGGAPSEQEAYNGAKALLEELKARGITLELPNFDVQVDRQPDHVTVQAEGLTVRFDRSVQGPPGVATTDAVSQALDLGSSTALVAAFDQQRAIDVSFDGEKKVVKPSDPGAAPSPGSSANPPPPQASSGSKGGRAAPAPAHPKPGRPDVRSGPPVSAPEPDVAIPPAPDAPPADVAPPTGSAETGPEAESRTDEVALNADDVARSLGLRGARSVSQAFGAFLGLGLILPLARVVIKRLG